MIASVPFTTLTFFVYIIIPELRNFHGKCFLYFLACMAIVFSIVSWLKLSKWNYVAPFVYHAISYVLYPLIFSASLWLSVISFDIWLSFR